LVRRAPPLVLIAFLASTLPCFYEEKRLPLLPGPSGKLRADLDDKLNAAVAGLLCPRIEAILGDRGPAHCLRVTDLDDEVMESAGKHRRSFCDHLLMSIG